MNHLPIPNLNDTYFAVPAFAAAGFVGGCVLGAIIEAPILVTGALVAICNAAQAAIRVGISDLGRKKEWNPSTVTLITALANASIGAAYVTAAVALGIFGSTGATVVSVLAVLATLSTLRAAHTQRLQELNPPLSEEVQFSS